MPLYLPPKDFLTHLTEYDSLLRVRWSDRKQVWRIERKITRSRPVDPALFRSSGYEEYICARDGYTLILECQHNQLDDRVFYTLWDGDMQRLGGANAVMEEYENTQESNRARSRRAWRSDIHHHAVERYRYWNTLSASKHTVS